MARGGKVRRVGIPALRATDRLLHAVLLLSCAQCVAAPGGGLLLEPARRQPMPTTDAVPGRGNMRLLPPDRPVARAFVIEKGVRFDTGGRREKPASPAGDLSLQIEAAAAAYGHDASLIKAIVRVESAFDPEAVSSKGAMGLMQIMPATAVGLGVVDPRRRLLDPDVNLLAGAHHLHLLRMKFPDRLDLAIAAYNAGEGAVVRWSGVPPYAETRAYVQAVLEWAGRYRNGYPDVAAPSLRPRCSRRTSASC